MTSLPHDEHGFLTGITPDEQDPKTPTLITDRFAKGLADDVHALREYFTSRKVGDPNHPSAKTEHEAGAGGRTTVAVATPPSRFMMGASVAPTKAAGVDRIEPAPPKIQVVATPGRTLETSYTTKAFGRQRDPSGRFVPVATPQKIQTATPDVKSSGGVNGHSTDKSRGPSTLANIGAKIGESVRAGLDDNAKVDPSIEAAQEVSSAIKGIGGMITTVATPMLGMFKAPDADAPTPWFRKFYNELRGLRREESVFNKAQLRTLNHIDGKEDGDKGGKGGILGMLAGLLMPLGGMIVSAIAAAIALGFGMLAKLPGLGALAKVADWARPGVGSKGKPITTVPDGSSGPSTATNKKPTLWEKTKSKVSGWMGKGAPDGAASIPGAATEAAKKPGLLSRAASGGKGLIKRIPWLGAALTAIGMGADVYASESDDTTTRAQKDKSTGKAIGGGGGAIAGMVAGGAAGAKLGALVGLIGGPVGAAIGAAIGGLVGGVAGSFFGEKAGDIVGETVGGWVTDLRNADIPGMIGRAWGQTTDFVVSAWTDTTKWFEKKWEGAVSLFTDVWDKAKGVFDDFAMGVTNLLSKFGIDLPAIKQKAMDAAAALSAQAGTVKDKVVQGATAAVDYGKEKAGQVGTALKESAVGRGAAAVSTKLSDGWSAAKGYLVGASTKADVDPGVVAKIAAFESGFDSNAAPIRKDGSKMSSAHGYGQFLDGTWTDMLNKHGAKYGVAGAGKLTKSDTEKLRGDKTLQAAMLAEFTKENIEKGRKFGGKDDDANAYAFHNLGDGDAKKLLTGMTTGLSVRESLMQGTRTDKDRARVEAVISGNKSLYGDGSITASAAYGRMGDVMRRGEVFAQDARATVQASLKPTPSALPTAVPAVGAVMPAIPKLPTMAFAPEKIPDFQPVTAAMSATMGQTSPRTANVTVSSPKQVVDRDLSNRRIAHVATGGLSGV